jgi:hypothetical protein
MGGGLSERRLEEGGAAAPADAGGGVGAYGRQWQQGCHNEKKWRTTVSDLAGERRSWGRKRKK